MTAASVGSSNETMNYGCTIWLTGLSGAGKTTMAHAVSARLLALGVRVEIVDGDAVRNSTSKDLGHTPASRREQTRRVGLSAERLSHNGAVVIAALISPYQASRDEVRAAIPNFVEVHLHCPLPILIERDTKGLYRQAIAGELTDFPGVSSPYEPPVAPEVFIDTSMDSVEQGVEKILRAVTAVRPLPTV